MQIEKTTLAMLVIAVLLIFVGSGGLHVPPIPLPTPNPPGPVDPEKPVANVKAAAHAAAVAYFKDVSVSYKKLADAPPKTVRDAMAQAKADDVASRDRYWKSLAAIMQPAIGSDDLDPAVAKKTFADMADGFAGVK